MPEFTGTAPVHALSFKVNTLGRGGSSTGEVVVKDAESLSISFDGNVEEWNTMDAEGWVRRAKTSKSITIAMGGKRNYGDLGNDYVAGLAYKDGKDVETDMTITFPDGATLKMPCVIVVTSAGGDATGMDALEWDAQSDGKPTYTPATTTN